jgi:tripartite-type tricarboxylate transporter receptor subunit TctC
MHRTIFGAALASLLALTGTASAQEWPNRAVTMVVPFAAGGPQDTIARVVAAGLGEILGQQVVIENIGGAGGMLGGDNVARAAPDGYKFGLGTVGTHAQGQTLYKKPLYNSVTDFTPVGLVAETPIALLVRKGLPVSNLQEFIAYAKANQAKMSFGSAGPGSATHLGCVVVNMVLGLNVEHIAYRGTGPAMADLLSDRSIDYICDIINTAKPQIEGGTVKGLAIMTKERSPVLPNLATGLEQGVKEFEAYTWTAFFLPKGTPDAIVKKLNAAIVQTINTPAVRERLQGMGAQVVSNDRATPEYLAKFVPAEIQKWAAPIKASGVTVD